MPMYMKVEWAIGSIKRGKYYGWFWLDDIEFWNQSKRVHPLAFGSHDRPVVDRIDVTMHTFPHNDVTFAPRVPITGKPTFVFEFTHSDELAYMHIELQNAIITGDRRISFENNVRMVTLSICFDKISYTNG